MPKGLTTVIIVSHKLCQLWANLSVIIVLVLSLLIIANATPTKLINLITTSLRTITIVRSEHNHVFGGFTTQSWDGNICKKYEKEWLFVVRAQKSILSKYSLSLPLTMDNINATYGILCHSTVGPGFGLYDFQISSHSNTNQSSQSDFPNCYDLSVKSAQSSKKDLLAGSGNFKVLDYEVFQVL